MRGLFIGVTTLDLIYPVEKFPLEDSKTNIEQCLIFLGGPATNAAITFAALGGSATLISAIGKNPWSGLVAERLSKYHVTHVDLVKYAEYDIACSSILVNKRSGLRTVITARPQSLPSNLQGPRLDLQGFDVCCLDGFYGDYVLETLGNKSSDLPVVFDGGSFKPRTDEILSFVNYPIFSERFEFADEETLTTSLAKRQILRYAVTAGSKSISYLDHGVSGEIAVDPVEAIDTLAAGDVFHGAFAYFILQHRLAFRQALIESMQVAAQSTRFLGPRSWMEK